MSMYAEADPVGTPDVVRKAFRAGVEGKRFIDATGLEYTIVGNDTDGPCERFMQSIPFIDGIFSARPAYEIGRSLLLLGFHCDLHRIDVRVASNFVGHLGDSLRAYHDSNPASHWSARQTLDLFGSFPFLGGSSVQDRFPDMWSHDLEELLQRVSGPSERLPDCTYTHPSLAAICNDVVPNTRSLHVSPECYGQLEDAVWERLDTRDIPTNAAFVVHVDGDRWLPAIDDPSQQVRTNYLYAGFDPQGAILLEHTAWRKDGADIRGRAIGCEFHHATRSLEWISSENVLVNGQRFPMLPPNREKNRIFRVAIGLLALIKHPRTSITPITGQTLMRDHYVLKPPADISVDEAILTVLLRKKQ